ncbi:MAG: substrate-binding domain-containing protein [Candidatus Dormiibacterota bacterium]
MASTVKIDRDSFVPLYVQLKNVLERRILGGELHEGEALESEPGLCRTYGVSRITVRQALRDLELAGMIRREPGRGTFVAAASTRRGVSIGLIYDLKEHVFEHRDESMFGDVVRGAADVTSRHGALVHPIPLDDDDELEALLATPIVNNLDGLLLLLDLGFPESTLVALDRTGLPYVALKRRLTGRAACVYADDRAGARAATAHLLGLGHERVAIVLSPKEMGHDDRLAGYEAALAEAGQPTDPRLIIWSDYPVSEGGANAMRELLRLPDPPRAVFAASDHVAVGVYQALRETGLEPGRDVAVIGYGGASFAATMYPALSTISTLRGEVGAVGAELLLDVITGAVPSTTSRTVSWRLDVRESTDWEGLSTVDAPRTAGWREAGAAEGGE